ncbi:protein UPSTREAM OF FLC-like [Dorcoceras hygrometricum]|uniref:Protein UPSTREAM OF FLC-like n=1 Tax=Dorcoceras hygrometricum TaxID=472368 RepID=A0A2Z7AR09_9LAMI|nr:protein UPSTREAM OF FLC-like [Dorcoceras hygrometricum]
MEAQLGAGAEVRRLNVVYFLSRKGRIEHPHLIRIHHLSRNGVRLRDVKRWLGDLRGKDMPESFSWSYKRRYKTGYVWQDLFDDDLITPISDNEYVVKGSEISSTISNRDFACSQRKSAMQKDKQPVKDHKTDENQSHSSETSLHVPRNSSSEIEEESLVFGSETSTLTDDSIKLETEKNSDTAVDKNKENKPEKIETSWTSDDSKLKNNKKDKSRSNRVKMSEKISTTPADSSDTSSEPRFEKSKSYSTGASSIFRNLMSCGALSTNDSAVVMINKQHKYPLLNVCVSDKRNVDSSQICKRDKLGGSHRIFGTPKLAQSQWSGRKSCDGVMDATKNKIEFKDHRVPCAANFKPINWPICS